MGFGINVLFLLRLPGTYSLLGTSAQSLPNYSTLTVTVNECLGVKPVNERNFIKFVRIQLQICIYSLKL